MTNFDDDSTTRFLHNTERSLCSARTSAEVASIKAEATGAGGFLSELARRLSVAPPDARPALGKRLNSTRAELHGLFDAARKRIEANEVRSLVGPPIDPSLPSPDLLTGTRHPLTIVREELRGILAKVGFNVVEGPEAETEYYCFDALNTPPGHTARDAQDTFYFPDEAIFFNVSRKVEGEKYLLRTQTSSVQIRTMLQGPAPIRIVSPGRVYRRDKVDATHSANFHQLEGLYVDRNVTVADLKALLDFVLKSLLGSDVKVRFRPHYFPYTEPSFEVDLSAKHLPKVNKEWVEIMGCGMVDPAVFDEVGYDSSVWSGYAFGMGIERIAMMMYGIDDIRQFYQNDLRFLRQFA